MATGAVFSINGSGDVTRMRPGAPELETDIQALIAQYPDLIGEEGELLSICREASISDVDGGSGRWALDNLFVTQAAIPVLVECKRGADSRIRREVVAQMFEYAANCTNWRAGDVRRLFEETCSREGLDPDIKLREFLPAETTLEDFWGKVDANLRSGKMRLLFVADRIPAELAKIVEFLNEQMTCEVLAVELNWFVDATGSKSIVPRTIGATQRAEAQRRNSSGPSVMWTDRSAWIQEYVEPHGPRAIQLLKEFFVLSDEIGGRLELKKDWAAIVLENSNGVKISAFGAYSRGKFAINIGLARKISAGREAYLDKIFKDITDIVGPFSGKTYASFDSSAILEPVQRPVLVGALRNFVNFLRV